MSKLIGRIHRAALVGYNLGTGKRPFMREMPSSFFGQDEEGELKTQGLFWALFYMWNRQEANPQTQRAVKELLTAMANPDIVDELLANVSEETVSFLQLAGKKYDIKEKAEEVTTIDVDSFDARTLNANTRRAMLGKLLDRGITLATATSKNGYNWDRPTFYNDLHWLKKDQSYDIEALKGMGTTLYKRRHKFGEKLVQEQKASPLEFARAQSQTPKPKKDKKESWEEPKEPQDEWEIPQTPVVPKTRLYL